VFFDKRGTGLSDRSMGTGALEDRMDDVRAVMDANDMESAVLLGMSEGGPMSVLLAATYPERVDRLMLYGGFALGSDFLPPEMVQLLADNWGNGSVMQKVWCNGAGDLAELGRIERATATPRALGEFLALNATIDIRPVLSSVSVPTLVTETADRWVGQVRTADLTRELAAGIPDARLELIEGTFHGTSDLAEADRVIDLIEEFVTGQVPGARDGFAHRVLATVLFTDLVGSTRRASSEGDQGWMRILGQHDRVCHEVIDKFRGKWIKSTGDGVVATFDGPARAISAAQRIAEDVQSLESQIRAGVHTGEIELRDDDIGGRAVNIAARVMNAADDGEVWVSGTVPGLTIGSGIEFTNRGQHELGGVPGSWELYSANPTS